MTLVEKKAKMERPAGSAVVDADGHILEPRDLWTKNLPAKFRDEAIQVRWNDETHHEDAYINGYNLLPGLANTFGSARSPATRRADMTDWRWEELPAAGLDPRARVNELDRDEIDICVCYPSLGLFLGGIKDPEHSVAAHRIYNDWLAEYCSVAPNRLVGIAAVSLHNPEAAAAEARRAVEELGMRGVFVRPNAYNEYHMHQRAFDPLWEVCEGLGVPVGLHPAGTPDAFGAASIYGSLAEPDVVRLVKPLNFFIDDIMAFTLFVGSGALDRFPELKVVILECGLGWLPWWTDKANHWAEVDAIRNPVRLKMKPSDYIHRQVWVSGDPDETTFPSVAASFGDDRLVWASDFPHMDVLESEPSATKELYENMVGMPESSVVKILGSNALELYGLRR